MHRKDSEDGAYYYYDFLFIHSFIHSKMTIIIMIRDLAVLTVERDSDHVDDESY